ncbi:alpha/beta-hydrolase [Purpureocillium lavendulum]|uniref:Alpha/beta-hydrolase n=1 Tax=Purpureocillium lavendulum TaxID=1247861 RepID=A0AB34FYJ2_9HYPO|nr:alpha/beta-hydrolase [Purpureocillium lavendulum]
MATYETAPDRYITVGSIRFAYRWLGPRNGIPLVLLMHFRGTMDHWDPALLNPLAAVRPVILIDNAGVGRSGGEVPKMFAGWAQHYIDVIQALGIKRADVMGFSMGGCVAQMVALNAPKLVRSLVLCGTIPSEGEGVTRAPIGPFNQLKAADTDQEQRDAFLDTFFTSSERSQAAGRASWERIVNARPDRTPAVPADAARRQAIAFAKFMDPKQAKDASYDRFHELKLPVLIANGNDDQLLPTENSIVMWKKLSRVGAQLHLYPDSGHGFLFQNAGPFAALINTFLDSAPDQASRL